MLFCLCTVKTYSYTFSFCRISLTVTNKSFVSALMFCLNCFRRFLNGSQMHLDCLTLRIRQKTPGVKTKILPLGTGLHRQTLKNMLNMNRTCSDSLKRIFLYLDSPIIGHKLGIMLSTLNEITW